MQRCVQLAIWSCMTDEMWKEEKEEAAKSSKSERSEEQCRGKKSVAV
jgi:hypothetical protein